MWYVKLNKYFKENKVSNKQLAVILGYSETMISRYLNGIANINAEFIGILIKNFPEIDLQYIFNDNYKEGDDEINLIEEPQSKFMNVDFELQKMEERIGEIRLFLRKNKDEN